MGKIRKQRKSAVIQEEQQNVAPVAENDKKAPPVVAEIVTEPTSAQIESEINELANEPVVAPKKRIWEVDFLRGFMILFVVWDHFMYDIRYGMGSAYKTQLFQWLYEVAGNYYAYDGLRALTHDTFVSMFVFTSGVSCSFSKSNGKRALKMMCFALLLSAVTYAVSKIVQDDLTVNFNVIHVIALSVFLWTCLEWLYDKFTKDWQRNLYGWIMFALVITILIVGYQAKVTPWTSESKIWFFLAEHDFTVPGFSEFWGGDYLAFFPDFGWFLVGAFLGKKLYKQKTTLFPSFNEKWVLPITFCGRYSIWVYFASQVLMYGLLYLFYGVFGIL